LDWGWCMKLGWLVVGLMMIGLRGVQAQQLPEAPSRVAAQETKGFFARWGDFYRDDWDGVAAKAAAAATAAPRRGLASPLDSPPFPSADWSYGGSPTLGESDGNVYPLQTAINGAKGRTKVYGWVSPSGNLSTSRNRNLPETNDIFSNRVELQQFVVYVERLPDSVQRDHVDLGISPDVVLWNGLSVDDGQGILQFAVARS
jgi:hypothetical protein